MPWLSTQRTKPQKEVIEEIVLLVEKARERTEEAEEKHAL